VQTAFQPEKEGLKLTAWQQSSHLGQSRRMRETDSQSLISSGWNGQQLILSLETV